MISKELLNECREIVTSHRNEIVALARHMVTIPSLSGQEGPVAEIVLKAMQTLDYDMSWIDTAGNAVGIVKGGSGPTTILNGHLDVVDAGDPHDWSYPPFSGELHEGYMWGRGSADMKCGMTGMIFAAGLLKKWGRKSRGDVIVTAVGLEEIGGWGTYLYVKNSDLKADRAVVGEPTKNRLLPGHRGRIGLKVHISGKSMHGGLANSEANPLFSFARFINSLEGVTHSLRQRIGYLAITPTTTICPPTGSNATSSAVTQVLDVRTGPDIMPEMIIPELNEMLQSILGKECTGNIFTAKQQIKTHTGVELAVDDFVPGYELSTDDEWFVESRNILGGVLGRDPLGDVARFTCDANRLYQAGIPTVIFGPGDISVAHTTNESISIEQLLEGVVCYMALVL